MNSARDGMRVAGLLFLTASLAWAQADNQAAPSSKSPGAKHSASQPEKKSTLSLSNEPASRAKETEEDEIEDIQSFNTYTSLEDGQPGQRGELQINYFNGWQTMAHTRDPWLMLTEIEYSPKSDNWLLKNAKFSLDVPLELSNGGVDGNGDIILIWKQRLLEEDAPHGKFPTVTIENELRLPTGYQSSGVDWTLQGVLAKEFGPGTAVLNAWLKSANGTNNVEPASWWERTSGQDGEELRHFQWGFRVGYKWRITDSFALVTDYVQQTHEMTGFHNQNFGECAAEWRVNSHLTIGPGVLFTLDGGHQTPNFGAGVLIHYSWD